MTGAKLLSSRQAAYRKFHSSETVLHVASYIRPYQSSLIRIVAYPSNMVKAKNKGLTASTLDVDRIHSWVRSGHKFLIFWVGVNSCEKLQFSVRNCRFSWETLISRGKLQFLTGKSRFPRETARTAHATFATFNCVETRHVYMIYDVLDL